MSDSGRVTKPDTEHFRFCRPLPYLLVFRQRLRWMCLRCRQPCTWQFASSYRPDWCIGQNSYRPRQLGCRMAACLCLCSLFLDKALNEVVVHSEVKAPPGTHLQDFTPQLHVVSNFAPCPLRFQDAKLGPVRQKCPYRAQVIAVVINPQILSKQIGTRSKYFIRIAHLE